MNVEKLILAALVLPIFGALGIVLARRSPNVREGVTLVTAVAAFTCVIQLVGPVLAGSTPLVSLIEPLPGLPVAFRVEPLGILFGLVASGLWIVNSIYSIGYMRGNNEKNQTRFYVCFALSIAAALGIAFSANLLTLFLFYEILTLITYPLVTHAGTDKAKHGGRVYLCILMGTSMLFLLPAIIYTWHVAGTVEFRPGGILPAALAPVSVTVLLAFFMFGIGKAALMPFHRWLPAAMVAPTPVSALLHAVAVVKAGVFSVVKVVVYVFGSSILAGATDWLIVIAGFTIIAASVVALNADNFKRRLAYSTVSQLSYIVLAAAVLAPLSTVGAALHIVSHALGKITLFFAAGAIYTAAHKTEISQFDGIGRRMPWTMTAFTIGALSIIGIPPFVGFVSKWYIMSGVLSAGMLSVAAIFMLSTLLNAAYLLPIVHRAFFRPPRQDDHHGHDGHHGEAPLPIVIAICITAAGTLVASLFPDVLIGLAQRIGTGGTI